MGYDDNSGFIEREIGEAVVAMIDAGEAITRSGILNYLTRKRQETGNAAYKEMLHSAMNKISQGK